MLLSRCGCARTWGLQYVTALSLLCPQRGYTPLDYRVLQEDSNVVNLKEMQGLYKLFGYLRSTVNMSCSDETITESPEMAKWLLNLGNLDGKSSDASVIAFEKYGVRRHAISILACAAQLTLLMPL